MDAAVRIDPEYQRQYNEHYAQKNIFLIKGEQQGVYKDGHVVTGQMVCSDGDVLKSEYYADYLRPQDLFHTFGGVLARTGSLSSFLISVRSRGAGPFEDEVRILKLLMPHLRRAVRIHQRIAGLEAQTHLQADALDHLAAGVVLLNGAGVVVTMNASARRLIADADGLGITNRRLAAWRPAETAQLSCLVKSTSKTGDAVRGGAMPVSRPSGKRPLSLMVIPLSSKRTSHRLPAGGQGAVIFITEPDAAPSAECDHLRTLFGLTPTEARIANLLASGVAVQQVADALQITQNTARWHVKHALEKTRSRSQSELVKLVLTGPAIVRFNA